MNTEYDDEYLQLAGIQHYAFCPRQWALIHIENQWSENERTIDGHIFHERTHNEQLTEKRGDLLITRGMRVSSSRMKVSGQCDVVEFHRDLKGISLNGRDGLWRPYPIEYKKGEPKDNQADELQLCCQAMCLEEMLACDIFEGSLFYGEIRRRQTVSFSPELRKEVERLLSLMHEHLKRGYTPKPKQAKRCNACSLSEICLPKLGKYQSPVEYMSAALKEGDE